VQYWHFSSLPNDSGLTNTARAQTGHSALTGFCGGAEAAAASAPNSAVACSGTISFAPQNVQVFFCCSVCSDIM